MRSEGLYLLVGLFGGIFYVSLIDKSAVFAVPMADHPALTLLDATTCIQFLVGQNLD